MSEKLEQQRTRWVRAAFLGATVTSAVALSARAALKHRVEAAKHKEEKARLADYFDTVAAKHFPDYLAMLESAVEEEQAAVQPMRRLLSASFKYPAGTYLTEIKIIAFGGASNDSLFEALRVLEAAKSPEQALLTTIYEGEELRVQPSDSLREIMHTNPASMPLLHQQIRDFQA